MSHETVQDRSETDAATLPQGVMLGIACGLAAAALWGAWPVVSRFGVLQTLTPLDLVALRFAIAGLILLPVVLRRGMRGLGVGKTTVLTVGAGAPYALVAIIGLSFAPAGHGGVIIPSCMLATSALGGWLILGDLPDRARLVGYALILSGVVITGWQGLTGGGGNVWIGDVLFVLAGILWATYTIASRAWQVDAFHATAVVSVVSMVLYLPVYLFLGSGRLLQAPISEIVFQGVFQGVMVAILALVFYTRAVGLLGAARGSVFAALVPVTVVLLAIPVLGEIPSPIEWVGVGMVCAGLVLALNLHRMVLARR